MNVKHKNKRGNFCMQNIGQAKSQTLNSQLIWMKDIYSQLKDDMHLASKNADNIYFRTKNIAENRHLHGISVSEYVNRKLDKGSNEIISATENNMNLLENLQICPIKCNKMDYDLMLQRGYHVLNQFLNPDEIEEHINETTEQTRFKYLIKAVYIFSKIQRLDIISRMSEIKEYRDKLHNDQQAVQFLSDIKDMIMGIELYQNGMWQSALQHFENFLKKNYQIMNTIEWLRLFERTWYLAITTNFGDNQGAYLPVNALNFVAEDIEVFENLGSQNDNFTQIHIYEKEVDFQKSNAKGPKKNPLDIFKKLLNHFKEAYEEISANRIMDTQKVLVSSFNMIGTLAANCDQLSKIPYKYFEYFIEIYSETNILHNENVEKFVEYFGDQQACNNFRNDFLSIEDEQKNDTLYYDVDEDSNNQYLVLLFIKPVSEDSEQSVQDQFDKYYQGKVMKMIKQKIIMKRMHQPLMNFALKCKSKDKLWLKNLSVHEYNWISVNQIYNSRYALKLLFSNSKNVENLKTIYQVQNQLINVFFNHFSIRNSLDTHFVVVKLNEINSFLQNCFYDENEEEKVSLLKILISKTNLYSKWLTVMLVIMMNLSTHLLKLGKTMKKNNLLMQTKKSINLKKMHLSFQKRLRKKQSLCQVYFINGSSRCLNQSP